MKNFELFQDLNPQELSQVMLLTQPHDFKKGELIFKEGLPGKEMVLLESGQVEIFITDSQGNEVVLSHISAGNFFGEMAMIEKLPRSASCRGEIPGRVLELSGNHFLRLQTKYPAIGLKILTRMLKITTDRLMNTGGLVSRLVQFGEESRRRAVTDPATGLFNRRYFDASFDELFAFARANSQALSLAMFDMDHFGNLNKAYGQEFGDKVIVAAAEVFRQALSPSDIIVRYGGDEFLFIFPSATAQDAQLKCQRVNEGIRRLVFENLPEVKLTCSLGLADFPNHAATTKELSDKADAALYLAKQQGRDRTTVYFPQ